MTTTIITAGGASDSLALSGGNDGTLTLQTGPSGAKVNALAFASDGTPTFLKSVITPSTAIATTSGTSATFTGIPAGVNRVTVALNRISLSGTAYPLVQLGSGSFVTTGYDYYWVSTQGVGLVTTATTSGFAADGGSASIVMFGTIVLTRFSGNLWTATANGGSTNSGNYRSWNGGGSVTLSGALDRLRIISSNGTDTFDDASSSVNILWE